MLDDDVVKFLQTIKSLLKPGGYVIIKENVPNNYDFSLNDDETISRSTDYIENLASKAGLSVQSFTINNPFAGYQEVATYIIN